jgi:hypothetical protein
MRQVIREQDSQLKGQVKLLVEKTQQSDEEKARLVEELKKLREEMAR